MEHADVVVVGGGQSGLAAAHALRGHGLTPVILEASEEATGSWRWYYESLTLFSPARYSSLPGLAFGGDGDRYPHRDEVVAYLRRYADHLGAEIRTGHRVLAVHKHPAGLRLEMDNGAQLTARGVVAATGSFGSPYRPALPGLDTFTGTLLHAAEYGTSAPFTAQRVLVIGSGNTAVQVGVELATTARVTLASRTPVRWAKQRPLGGRDLHYWLAVSGLDTAPLGRFVRRPPTQRVIDDGHYRAAVEAGAPDRQPMIVGIEGSKVTWDDGGVEDVDAIVLATGYRPDLDYLTPLGALSEQGIPLHRDGTSLVDPAVAFVGLEWQRSLSSASLRGVGRDAQRIARRLSVYLARR